MASIQKNYQDVNSELELIMNTGEILQDFSSTGKERPWKIHKQENLRLVEIYKMSKEKDLNLISDSRLHDLEHCADTLVFCKMLKVRKN